MANSVDPDQMHSVASDPGLQCLQRPSCPNTYGYYDISILHLPICDWLLFVSPTFQGKNRILYPLCVSLYFGLFIHPSVFLLCTYFNQTFCIHASSWSVTIMKNMFIFCPSPLGPGVGSKSQIWVPYFCPWLHLPRTVGWISVKITIYTLTYYNHAAPHQIVTMSPGTWVGVPDQSHRSIEVCDGLPLTGSLICVWNLKQNAILSYTVCIYF